MVVMQKRKLMQEFTLAINVGCLRSNLLTKLLMHNCACAKHTKTYNVTVAFIGVEWKVHMMYLSYIICLISSNPRNDSKIKIAFLLSIFNLWITYKC